MAVENKIHVGQGMRVRGMFRDPESGERVEPGEVSIIFMAPDGQETLVVTERVEEPEKNRVSFRGVKVADMPGIWHWRMVSDPAAPGAAAREGYFKVEPTQFTLA